MITDASETRFQEKLHPGILCAIHPDEPFDFAEKAYWMFPDPALKAFVDQWLHLAKEDGEFDGIYARWFSLRGRFCRTTSGGAIRRPMPYGHPRMPKALPASRVRPVDGAGAVPREAIDRISRK
jgi:hypothetical protein